MKIGGFMKLTLLDYPEKVACTVFTVGCNFRCPFCHNASLVEQRYCQELSVDGVLQVLKKRKHILEGMCLTGGEPLLQKGVDDFLRKVKALGYKVKLDTNGSFPQKLMDLVQEGLVDYVAMDIKNSIDMYNQTAGCNVDMDSIVRSVDFLKQGTVDYEFRTTVTKNFHSEQSIRQMAQWLQGAKRYYLQQFVDSGDLIDNSITGVDDNTLHNYLQIVQEYIPHAVLRGID